MTLPATKIGDKGQRFVVRARWAGETRDVGYVNDHPEKMVNAIFIHPAVTRAWAFDRKRKQNVSIKEKAGR